MKAHIRPKEVPHAGRLEVSIVESTQDFCGLEEEWDELYQASPKATPFQSWAWLYSWWEHYGEGYELRLVTVRDGGLLVGLIPLMIERRWIFGRLMFVGSGITDYLDMLARKGYEERVAKAGIAALKRIGGWGVADLQQLRPSAIAWSLLRDWNWFRTYAYQTDCVEMEVKPWDDLLHSISKNRRKTARRTIGRLESDGVYCEAVRVENAYHAAGRFLELHRQYWQGRNIGPEHLTRRFESHLRAAAPRLTACRVGQIHQYVRGEEVVMSELHLVGHDFVMGYSFGADDYVRSRFDINVLHIWRLQNTARDQSSDFVSLGQGNEEWKRRWPSRVVPNHRMILGRGVFMWSLYAGYHCLHAGALRYARIHRESIPQWVKTFVAGYSSLRYKAALLWKRGRADDS